MINSIEAQMDETSEPAPKECSTTQQVIENGQKIISPGVQDEFLGT
jgi:hypothetical protein